MNILGFSDWLGSHDAAAAIVCDGVLVAAAEEERFTRRKHDGGIPVRAIEFCLRHAGIRMSQVDFLAIPVQPFRTGRDSFMAEVDINFLKRLIQEGVHRRRALVHKVVLDAYLRTGLPVAFNLCMQADIFAGFNLLREHFGDLPPVRFYDHHRAHAAVAYFTSGYDQAAVVTIDGRGGNYATVTWSARGGKLRRLRAEPFTNSLGFFYRDCTRYLGFGEFGEGKTMGLAAYGDKESWAGPLGSMLQIDGTSWYQYRAPPNESVLGFRGRERESALESPYPDFAAACQSALERAVARVVKSAIDESSARDLCLGGGVTLNCSSNGSLLASNIARSIWVFPATGDAGLSVGVAMLCANDLGELQRGRLENAYWGPDFNDADCEMALRQEPRITYSRVSNVVEETARCLAAGRSVGWFQNRMELGPRALGNRSILADPRSSEMKDRINRIKGREPWRPLAPVVVADKTSDFFALNGASPFMLFATEIRPERRAVVPAVVHVDGSARPQTVTRKQNPCLYELLSCFYRHTGVPLLLNTSFNAAGEPIVCSPGDAIKTFLATGLDLLVVGNYAASRKTIP